MKSLLELRKILVDELLKGKDSFNSSVKNEYYNEILGDTSFILMAILESELIERNLGWDDDKWIDDSLITQVRIDKSTIMIWGVAIWGKDNTTEQWTDPFYFHSIIDDSQSGFLEYTFLFGESGEEISYEEFNKNRGMWDTKFYEDDKWDVSERDWSYIINYNSKRKNTKQLLIE